MRELTQEKKIGLDDIKEIDHSMNEKLHSATSNSWLATSWEER